MLHKKKRKRRYSAKLLQVTSNAMLFWAWAKYNSRGSFIFCRHWDGFFITISTIILIKHQLNQFLL
jgi:hypothetical protein